MAETSRNCSVYGHVNTINLKAARDLIVTAFAQHLRGRRELSRSATDKDGEYTINYALDRLNNVEQDGANLIIEVASSAGELLFTSNVMFNAASNLEFNVQLKSSPSESEYDRIVRLTKSLIDGHDVRLQELEENQQFRDVSFLAGETGISRDQLTAFAIAQRLGTEQLPASFWFALMRTGAVPQPLMPLAGWTTLQAAAQGAQAAAMSIAPGAVESGLKKAISRQILGTEGETASADWVSRFRDMQLASIQPSPAGGSALSAPPVEVDAKPAPAAGMQTILALAGVPEAKHAALVEASFAHDGHHAFIERLGEDNLLDAAQRNAVQTFLHVKDIGFGDVGVAVAAKQLGVDPQAANAARDMARASAEDWQRAMQSGSLQPPSNVAGDTPEMKLANYAKMVQTEFADRFPGTAFAAELARKPDSLSNGGKLGKFLNDNPDFDLATTGIDRFLKEKSRPDAAGLEADKPLVGQLKQTQRIFKLAPTFDATRTLIADGLQSAHQIYRMGKPAFVEKFSGKPGFADNAAAATVFERAANMHAAAMAISGQLQALDRTRDVSALNSGAGTGNIPDLANLFKDISACDCDECSSVFGASAYLADLLIYLKYRPAKDSGATSKSVLFDRRPAIGDIALNCSNTNTMLPYIDLVCEILEDRVAPWKSLPASVAPSLVAGAVQPALQDALKGGDRPAIEVSATAVVSDDSTAGKWMLRDGDRIWRIRSADGGAFEVSVLRQTTETSDDLAASPEYVSEAAYDKLAKEAYPASLPFDLPSEEVRGYLAKVGVRRSDVMEAFSARQAPVSDGDIASEYLGLSSATTKIIITSDASDQFKYWGQPDNPAAIAKFSTVANFLDQTGISFGDLQALLALGFINPTGTILIDPIDASCDLKAKTITALDADAMYRIHRFLRLWRRLGWKMWEVDLVIRNAGIGNGSVDAAFLKNLSDFVRIREKLGSLSVEHACALFDKLNTGAKFIADSDRPEPSLYEKLFLNKRVMSKADLVTFAIGSITKGDSSPAAAPPIEGHADQIAAAIRTSSAELGVLLKSSLPSTDPAFGKLTLGNLSLLYRHNLLIKTIGIKAADWSRLLNVVSGNIFDSPANLLTFLNLNDRIGAVGYSIDELSYLLGADLAAKVAENDSQISSLLSSLRASLQTISAAHGVPIPADPDGAVSRTVAELQSLGWNAASVEALATLLKSPVHFAAPSDFDFSKTIAGTKNIPIAYDSDARTITFRGLMTKQQRDDLLSDTKVTGVNGLSSVIGAMYDLSHAAMRFYWPEFRVGLKTLPSGVQFSTLSPTLASKVKYDVDRLELVFFGAMTDKERDALKNLSGADSGYKTAVDDLYAVPTSAHPTGKLWVGEADDLGAAATDLVAYGYEQAVRTAVIQAISQAFGLTLAISEYLLTKLSGSGLDDLRAESFVRSSSTISAAQFPILFKRCRWLHRIALILGKSNPRLSDLDFVVANRVTCGLIDLAALLDYGPATSTRISVDSLLDFTRLLELQRAFASPQLAFFDVLGRLIAATGYPGDKFAADVSLLSGWPQGDLSTLTSQNGLKAVYPQDYLKVATWDNLVRCFDLMSRMNGSAARAISLAASVVNADLSQLLKQQLRAKFEAAQWRDLSKSVQDGLRQRKRDSLAAYLLAQRMPADAPTGKWDNSDDLYSYYLIDVDMGSCQDTSRIVQATNSVQLFVQRCFMGLEPKVRVSVTDDPGDPWKQWVWMKNYRVWEANRRVFVYPENYAEPELRLDRSEFFKKLEADLLQSDVTSDTVESAFQDYLDKLDEVAQLEIAGTYYQENTFTLHVFGRTPGREPHVYYYRQFISKHEPGRWTPWEKVDCDIKANCLVPVVANERLHLVWPEFRDEPAAQTSVKYPAPPSGGSGPLEKPSTTTDLYLAITEFRNGKWLPKKLSQEPIRVAEPSQNTFDDQRYVIVPLDFTRITLHGQNAPGQFLLLVGQVSEGGSLRSSHLFELLGCKGYPEPYRGDFPPVSPILTWFENSNFQYLKDIEQKPGDNYPVMPKDNLVLSSFGDKGLFQRTPEQFKISFPEYPSNLDRNELVVASNQPNAPQLSIRMGAGYDWFYADKSRTFFVRTLMKKKYPGRPIPAGPFDPTLWDIKVSPRNFYHPLTCFLIRQLNSLAGIDGLMSRDTQFSDDRLDFIKLYNPEVAIIDPKKKLPQEIIEFDAGESYAQYNWELFFFAPLMIAERLSANQKFEDAQRWFHYIFDPTGGHDTAPKNQVPQPPNGIVPSPQKYWITKPFFLNTDMDYQSQRIENLLSLLADFPVGQNLPPVVQELWDHIQEWREHPFDPHIVAQYRIVAYQKFVVMKYLDNLIAWGDQQFRQFTMESVNGATQLYILAGEILGPRPRSVRSAAQPRAETYNEIEPRLDGFSDAHPSVVLENLLPPAPENSNNTTSANIPAPLYFCVPRNDKLLRYWDMVADRLSKIRHCLDIDGVARKLALFAPPIDPMLLIQAMAGGGDLADAIAGLDAPLPNYRFSVVLRAANDMVVDLKALGAALLTALEKRDAEDLSRLRQRQELAVLNTSRLIKQAQIDALKQTLEGLQKSREMVTIRRDYYAARPFMNAQETAAQNLNTASLIVHTAGTVSDILGGVLASVPTFELGAAGFGGSPVATTHTGGSSFAKAAELAARALYQASAIMDKSAAMTATLASYQRRMDDWQFQVSVANKELEQMDRQITAAQIQVDNAQRELESHDLSIKNSKEVNAFFRDKYTNRELYQWTVTQISQTFWTSYQLAFDLAKRAERCFQYELGVENSAFIKFGYWDNLKSGLLAGENLQLALRQLENAYLETNRREFECTKHISLAVLNPMALLQLKNTGTCVVDIPEEAFDLDYPGHYFRRIKSVSLSLPCVAGPYTTVNATLRLIKSMVRVTSTGGSQYEHENSGGVFTDDPRFRESRVRVDAIAASGAQNDSGMFELNFRDDRYLPFEGGGAISTWQIELMSDRTLRQFDYDTISDVILHMHYTAREDVGPFKTAAIKHLGDVLKDAAAAVKLRQMFDLRREFATEWNAFINPSSPAQQALKLQLGNDHFNILAKDRDVVVTAVSLAALTKQPNDMSVKISPLLDQEPMPTLALDHKQSGYRIVTRQLKTATTLDASLTIVITNTGQPGVPIAADEFEECFLVIEYVLARH